ncbi:Fibropellin-1 [Holothuria leucospilota]|uniref:Fibropellin-1 n=1 Tax=Holothuria leucospilota TaxID=206669 RepID=A0A9Q1CEP0_HOLLE|nr:Fibropellin-1 [Holothuria leucospilota]
MGGEDESIKSRVLTFPQSPHPAIRFRVRMEGHVPAMDNFLLAPATQDLKERFVKGKSPYPVIRRHARMVGCVRTMGNYIPVPALQDLKDCFVKGKMFIVPRMAPCDSQPCLNGGSCFNLGLEEHSPFFCMCADGYDGMTCQTATDPCNSDPCANDGFCFSSDDGNMFLCLCVGHFSGPTCDETVSTGTDPCVESPCQNGGTCVINDDFTTTSCMCPSGYSGFSCETAVCPEGYCQNLATCRVLNGANSCFCGTGFTGIRCETRITPCNSNPCTAGGTCNEGGNGGFQCMCPEGRQGVRCETAVCPHGYCSNGGSCFVTMETRGDVGERFECSCAPGFTGERCGSDINECASAPCQNNGSCVDGIDVFYCDCQPGFGGPFCEHCYNLCLPDCEANFKCENYGTCVYSEADGEVFCDCLPGYMGSKCEIDIDECASTPCQNNGSCVDGIDEFHCDCQPGFGGPFCEHCYNLCLPDCEANFKCENYGTCVYSEADGEVFCDCLPGYMGSKCEIYIDECASTPCQNNGSCIDGVDQFYCDCQPGFGGPFANIATTCAYQIVQQISNAKTMVHASLERQRVPFSVIVFLDTREADVKLVSGVASQKDECESNPCPDGSVCIDYVDGYQCKCVRGSKPGCENTAAPAEACTDADRCPAGSECIDLFGGFFCICPEGEKDDSMCGKFIEGLYTN